MKNGKIFRKAISDGKIYFHALMITILTFGSLFFLKLMSFVFFDPLSKIVGFEMTDIYSYVISQREQPRSSEKIALLTLDGVGDRSDIARILRQVDVCHPKVVGLDVLFTYPLSPESDSLLLHTVNSMENIVLPCILSGRGEEGYRTKESVFFLDNVVRPREGFVNFAGNNLGVVRRFVPSLKYKEEGGVTKPVYSFPAHLLKVYDERLFLHNQDRGNEEPQLINFYPLMFDTIHWDDIKGNADLIKDRIVIMGYGSLKEDMHYTSSEDEMPGMKIHAYVLATMLDERYIREVDSWWSKLLGFFICYLFSLGCLFFLRKVNSGAGFFIRLVQTFFILSCLWAGYIVFLKWDINIYLIRLLLALGFTSFFADIYCGLWYWGSKLINKIRQ